MSVGDLIDTEGTFRYISRIGTSGWITYLGVLWDRAGRSSLETEPANLGIIDIGGLLGNRVVHYN